MPAKTLLSAKNYGMHAAANSRYRHACKIVTITGSKKANPSKGGDAKLPVYRLFAHDSGSPKHHAGQTFVCR
jgi:hypothetical protein